MIIRQDQLSLLFLLICLRGGMRNYSEKYASKNMGGHYYYSQTTKKQSEKFFDAETFCLGM